jgi:hypothetical protein
MKESETQKKARELALGAGKAHRKLVQEHLKDEPFVRETMLARIRALAADGRLNASDVPRLGSMVEALSASEDMRSVEQLAAQLKQVSAEIQADPKSSVFAIAIASIAEDSAAFAAAAIKEGSTAPSRPGGITPRSYEVVAADLAGALRGIQDVILYETTDPVEILQHIVAEAAWWSAKELGLVR